METQDDSLDIEHLKRVALGLQDEPVRGVSTVPNSTSFQKSLNVENRKDGGVEIAGEVDFVAQFVNASPDRSLNPPQHAPVDLETDTGLQPDASSTVPESPVKRTMNPTDSPPGDTQPFTQPFSENNARGSQPEYNGDSGYPHETARTEGADTTQKTLFEGDTGHLDLLGGLDGSQVAANGTEADGNSVVPEEEEEEFDIDRDSSPTHYQPFPESQRFLTRTPATAYKSRAVAGDMEGTSPSLPLNPFAQAKEATGVMSLSQVFNATQAASSPLTNVPRPEFSSDMPSPNIPIQGRLPSASLFSPSLHTTSPAPRTDGHTEPQSYYVSMKESQALREKLAGKKRRASNGNASSGSDDDDDEFEQEASFVQKRLRQKQIEEEVRQQFASATALSKPRGPIRGSGQVSSPSLTRMKQGAQALSTVLEDEDTEGALQNGNAGDTEEETEQEDETNTQTRRSQPTQSSGEDDKENFDSGPSQASNNAALAHDALSQALEFDGSHGVQLSTSQRSQRNVGDHTPAVDSEVTKIPNSQPSIGHVDASAENGAVPTNSSSEDRETNSNLERARFDQTRTEQQIEPYPLNQEAHRLLSHDGEDHPPGTITHDGPSAMPSTNETSSHYQTAVDIVPLNDTVAREPANNSSMSARVLETPAQNKPLLGNHHRTIPETSPAAQRNSFQMFARNHAALNDLSSPSRDEGQLPDAPQLTRAEITERLQVPETTLKSRAVSAIFSSPSGRQRRSMTEIASDQSPCQSLPDILPEDLGLMTAEDKEFFDSTVGGRYYTPKRRRGNHGGIIKPPVFERPSTTAVQTAEAEEKVGSAPAATPAPGSPQPEPRSTITTTEEARLESPAPDTELPRPRGDVVRGNRQPRSGRPGSVWDVEGSPQQVRGRKEKDRPLSLSGKHANSRSYSHSHPHPHPRIPMKPKHAPAVAVVIHKSSSPIHSDAIIPADSPEPEPQEEEERANLIRQERVSLEPEEPSRPAVAVTQVFAFFNGRPLGYFPATCVGVSQTLGSVRYLVRFEGSDSPVEVDAAGIKRLELKKGDVVKVGWDRNSKQRYVVEGFPIEQGDTSPSEQQSSAMTDVYGHDSVVLRPRQTPDSPGENYVVIVPISTVYFDKMLWNRVRERQYTHTVLPEEEAPRLQTPIDRHISLSVPPSRTPRSLATTPGLFEGMAFAVSFTKEEEQHDDDRNGKGKKFKDKKAEDEKIEDSKTRMEELLAQAGGRIFKDGFDELFDLTHGAPSAPSEGANGASAEMKLVPGAEHIGFACLIANEHSRRTKYMQALALNIPCLSSRWVHDCIAKNRILDWETYLLPAGESKLLSGAVRSRVLSPTDAATSRLLDTINNRPKFLAGQSVLLVMGRGQVAEQRRFLIHALGASKVERVQDLNEAIDMLRDEPQSWDWLYAGNQEAAKNARRVLRDDSAFEPVQDKRGRPLKRRRSGKSVSSSDVSDDSDEIFVDGKNIRVVEYDFLPQSLILGKLYRD